MISVKLNGSKIIVKTEGKLSSSDYYRLKDFMDRVAFYNKELYQWYLDRMYIDDLIAIMGINKIAFKNSYNDIKGIKTVNMPVFDLNTNHLDTMKLSPYPFQKVGISYLTSVKKGILADEMGLGKAQPFDAKVFVNENTYKEMGDIVIGDSVLGTDGTSQNVIGVFDQGRKKVFDILFSDGSKVQSTEDHLWITSQTADFVKDKEVLSLYEINKGYKKINGKDKFYVPKYSLNSIRVMKNNPKVYKEALFLVDGYPDMHKAIIHGKLTNQEIYLLPSSLDIPNAKLYKEEEDLYQLSSPTISNLLKHGFIKNNRIVKNKKISLSQILDNNLNEKDICSVISGLVDGSSPYIQDDSIKGSLKNIHTFNLLKEACAYLSFIFEEEHNEEGFHFFSIKPVKYSLDILNFDSETIESITEESSKTEYVSIQSITYAGKKACRCIKVENNNASYITDNYIVTHNTPTAIGAAHQLIQDKIATKILIITPSSLKYQWLEELSKFTDYKGIVINGTKKKRDEAFQTYLNDDSIQFCISNYESVKNDLAAYKEVKWDIIIADECHKIKNKDTQVSKAIKELKAPYIFGLTGTPMQNNPNELWNIMNWIEPKLLGPYYPFRNKYIAMTQKFGKAMVEVGFKNLDELRGLVSSKILRRMKADVMNELPELLIVEQYVEMTKDQQAVSDFVQSEMMKLESEVQEFKKKNRPYEDSSGRTVTPKHPKEDSVLGYLNTLITVSDTPELLLKSESAMLHKFASKIKDPKKIKAPKLEALVDICQEQLNNGNEKIVIFTQFKRMADIIQDELSLLGGVATLNGSMNPIKRQESVNQFKFDDNINFFVTTDAGNFGINLQFSNVLIQYDLPWNTAVYEQRIGRVHRIGGNHGTVTIINLLTKDSIDESIMKTIKRKKETSQQIIEKNEEEIKIMNKMIEDVDKK